MRTVLAWAVVTDKETNLMSVRQYRVPDRYTEAQLKHRVEFCHPYLDVQVCGLGYVPGNVYDAVLDAPAI